MSRPRELELLLNSSMNSRVIAIDPVRALWMISVDWRIVTARHPMKPYYPGPSTRYPHRPMAVWCAPIINGLVDNCARNRYLKGILRSLSGTQHSNCARTQPQAGTHVHLLGAPFPSCCRTLDEGQDSCE